MKIKILWAEYGLLYVKKLLDEDGVHNYGVCDNNVFEIRIEDLEPEDRKRVSVFHEIVHAIDYLGGLGMTENQIRGLSHGFYAVLKDNPKLAAHIVPGGKR